MTVTAFDNQGVEFDEDQYEHMAFQLEIEMTGIHRERGLQADKLKGQQRTFKVTGIESGNYVVTAYIDKFRKKGDQERVTSEANKIEVFPILSLNPPSLLLTPNMKYTLGISGGPSRGSYGSSIEGSRVDINITIKDGTIASRDTVREITGLQVGDTELQYTIIQTKQSRDGSEQQNIVSSITVPIRVRLVSHIEIPSNQQRIVYAGSRLKQLAVLKYNNETFSHGIAPISWDWNCSHSNILKPHFPTDFDQVAQQQPHHVQTKVIRDNKARQNKVF
jgi:hypothetical protein